MCESLTRFDVRSTLQPNVATQTLLHWATQAKSHFHFSSPLYQFNVYTRSFQTSDTSVCIFVHKTRSLLRHPWPLKKHFECAKSENWKDAGEKKREKNISCLVRAIHLDCRESSWLFRSGRWSQRCEEHGWGCRQFRRWWLRGRCTTAGGQSLTQRTSSHRAPVRTTSSTSSSSSASSWMNGWMDKWMNEWVSEWVSEWMK